MKAIDGKMTTKWLDSQGSPLLISCFTPVNVDQFTVVTANDVSLQNLFLIRVRVGEIAQCLVKAGVWVSLSGSIRLGVVC